MNEHPFIGQKVKITATDHPHLGRVGTVKHSSQMVGIWAIEFDEPGKGIWTSELNFEAVDDPEDK